MARKPGRAPSGFEPNISAGEEPHAKGVDIRCGWYLQDAGFRKDHFAALIGIEGFYYARGHIATLWTFHDLFKAGGDFVMRLTNKCSILGLMRVFSKAGLARDTRISRILQAQFHSIGLASLSRIMQNVGSDRIRIQPHAVTAP